MVPPERRRVALCQRQRRQRLTPLEHFLADHRAIRRRLDLADVSRAHLAVQIQPGGPDPDEDGVRGRLPRAEPRRQIRPIAQIQDLALARREPVDLRLDRQAVVTISGLGPAGPVDTVALQPLAKPGQPPP